MLNIIPADPKGWRSRTGTSNVFHRHVCRAVCTICTNCTECVVCNAARAKDLEISYSLRLPHASANLLVGNYLASIVVSYIS